ncbi:MAG: hypothetical protein AAF368_19855, partial [Planctomycetota bacterium]
MILLLFVLALAVEVSERVRVDTQPIDVRPIAVETVSSLSAEEVSELTEKLARQQAELDAMRRRLAEQRKAVARERAAVRGEQRLTGAREPAAINVAYDYRRELYYFAPSRDVEQADTKKSGESVLEYVARKRSELQALARRLRLQRGYPLEEMQSIYTAFSKYRE